MISPEEMSTWFQRDRMAAINMCLEDALACRSIQETMDHLTEIQLPQIQGHIRSSEFAWDDRVLLVARTDIGSIWRYTLDYKWKGIHIFGPVSPYRPDYESIESIVSEHVLHKFLRHAYKEGS